MSTGGENRENSGNIWPMAIFVAFVLLSSMLFAYLRYNEWL